MVFSDWLRLSFISDQLLVIQDEALTNLGWEEARRLVQPSKRFSSRKIRKIYGYAILLHFLYILGDPVDILLYLKHFEPTHIIPDCFTAF